ncbi:nuclear transcription factor Y subunit A-7 isoform X2 [Phalaenopsis equestris]|uniref:nuclear transcription factor Y subunit A-7 isoform X2 n=1 Tax=Phalaenopsis equestris TaxID=78828 RepID=UPI0009E18AB8|nr:nuclear transcription factor Y subunit A-7 isoform X2 [Phalaenopsis equestris]
MTPAEADSSGSESSGPDDQQKQSHSETQNQPSATGNFQPGIAMPSTVHFMPHSQLAAGHIMAPVAYPYVDPYYGGIIAAYSSQHMHPTMTGIMPGVPLPTDAVEEPVYVNAKQYHGILRRRQSRAKAESENKLIKSRKPYIHHTFMNLRHLHAMRRARGNGGRFLNSKGKDGQDDEASSHGNAQPGSGPTSQNPSPV